MRESSWRHGVTRYQWLVLFVAWLGWVFDSMDATIYALVLSPALHDLLRVQTSGEVSQEAIGWYGGIILSIFLIGWAIGGVVFGITNTFNPGSHYDLISRLLTIIVLGGLGSLRGAIIAALVMLVSTDITAVVISPVWASFVFFVILIAVLLLRTVLG